MFKKSLALALMNMFIPARRAPAVPNSAAAATDTDPIFVKGGKGQIRAAKGKPSGAAALKRAAKKRSNIRKHGG